MHLAFSFWHLAFLSQLTTRSSPAMVQINTGDKHLRQKVLSLGKVTEKHHYFGKIQTSL